MSVDNDLDEYVYVFTYSKDTSMDQKISELIKEYGGDHIGSGMGFGHRDHQVGFNNPDDANKFANRMKRYKNIAKIRMTDYDYTWSKSIK